MTRLWLGRVYLKKKMSKEAIDEFSKFSESLPTSAVLPGFARLQLCSHGQTNVAAKTPTQLIDFVGSKVRAGFRGGSSLYGAWAQGSGVPIVAKALCGERVYRDDLDPSNLTLHLTVCVLTLGAQTCGGASQRTAATIYEMTCSHAGSRCAKGTHSGHHG
jgi:hypothetical protein